MSDFFSDGESDRKASPIAGLPSIVEVPSETSSMAPESARSEDTEQQTSRTARSDDSAENSYDDEHYSDDDNEAYDTPRHASAGSGGRSRRGRVKNGRHHIDMTPPDKLLRKAEKKAKHYAQTGKSQRAMQELVRCTALARIVFGDGHWRLAKSHADLARGYLDIKAYAAQAQQHAETANSIMLTSVQMSTGTERAQVMEVLINSNYTLGRTQTLLKKYAAAEKALSRAEKIAQDRAQLSNVSERSVETWEIAIFQALARLHARQQNHAMAHEYFDKTLDVMIKKYGPDSVKLIPVYQALGKLEQSKDRHEEAIAHYEQAHAIATANDKEGSDQIAETAHALAMAYAGVSDAHAETSAESYLTECLAMYQSIHGSHHTKTLEVQDDLARLMIRIDRQDEGIGVLKSTIDAKKEVYGEYSPQVANTWKLIGNVHLVQGDSEKALRALKKCHNIECVQYGKNSKKSKETERTLDILMANPTLSSKYKKTDLMKERPRFNTVVNRSGPVGANKSLGF